MRTNMDIQDRLFLITGASSGIGAATARAAATQGANVLLLARNAQKLDELADEITRNGGKATPYPVDLADAAAIQATAEKIMRQVGAPDVLLNNAGAGRWLAITEASPEEAAKMMAVPYLAAYYLTHAFLPAMLRRDTGLIANMTSAAAFVAIPGATAYASARWAMRGFSAALQADLNRTHLKVMLIAFAKVRSAYFAHNPGSEDRIPRLQAMIPVISPETAAAAILTGIRHGREEVFAPAMLRVVLGLNALFPHTTRRLMEASGWHGNLLTISEG